MDAATIAGLPNLTLADSALHAPFAGFGDHEFYPEFVDKAAVLLERLARNHPLPDGNKRAAWVTLRVFVEINDWTWQPYPTVDEAERAVLAIAADECDHERISAWLKSAPKAGLPTSVSGGRQHGQRAQGGGGWRLVTPTPGSQGASRASATRASGPVAPTPRERQPGPLASRSGSAREQAQWHCRSRGKAGRRACRRWR
jgi:death on curing protein